MSGPRHRPPAPEEFEPYIDPTTFGIVRSYLYPRSVIRTVLLAEPPCSLGELASVISDPDRERGSARWGRLAAKHLVSVILPTAQEHLYPCFCPTVVAESIPGDTPCRVIYLPPFYLVALDPDLPGAESSA